MKTFEFNVHSKRPLPLDPSFSPMILNNLAYEKSG